jgi:hypothetical protein
MGCRSCFVCPRPRPIQCARAWPRVGVPVRLASVVGLPLPPARVPLTGPEPPCVYHRGLTQVRVLSSSAPASCCSGSSPEFRHRGPSAVLTDQLPALAYLGGGFASPAGKPLQGLESLAITRAGWRFDTLTPRCRLVPLLGPGREGGAPAAGYRRRGRSEVRGNLLASNFSGP